jgi:three-Cys-motif partner protein
MLAKSRSDKIAYIDLFAGPGRYEHGAKSTPVLILEQALEDEQMCQKLVTLFNDKDPQHIQSLATTVSEIPGIERLKHPPKFFEGEVDNRWVDALQSTRLAPTLFFVDPWGYKGLSLRLVNSVLKDWGCDCIFFFNYARVRMGIPNDKVYIHMAALFGQDRAEKLRDVLRETSPVDCEVTIIEALAEALKDLGGKFVLPFRFKNDDGTRTSHYLIFVTKAFLGYEIMKGIMARGSSAVTQGVANFEYCPASQNQPLLFELARPLEDLGNTLLEAFAGQTLTTKDIYMAHNIGTPYIFKNYQDALRSLESEGKITTRPPALERRRIKGQVTFAENVVVSFPKRK